jgi:multisubunit Na+/H+ antiporter MnhF subunit
MPYGLIVLVIVIALTYYYVFATSASLISKALVLGVLGFCLSCFFLFHRFALAASLIMTGLGIFISVYRIIAQARSPDRRDKL